MNGTLAPWAGSQVISPLVFFPLPYASPIHHPKSAILAGADSLDGIVGERLVNRKGGQLSLFEHEHGNPPVTQDPDCSTSGSCHSHPFGQGSRWGCQNQSIAQARQQAF